MVKLIIGIAGTIGAGKDTAADHLKKKYNFQGFTIGDLIREEAKELGIEETRDNLQSLSKERTDKFGEDYWIKKAADRTKQMNIDFAIINGIRRPVDVIIPRQAFGDKFKCIFVDADIKIRFERLKARKRFDDPKNIEDFSEQEKREWKQFDYAKTKELADFVVTNDAGVEELYKKLEELMKKLGF